MTKIVIIGAGSLFGSRLSVDILSRPTLRDATIALCDTNEERLNQVTSYVQRVIDAHELPATCVSSTDRLDLLPDADFVTTSISVGGAAYWGEPYASEINIPLKYGVDQIVADTIGPGGVFRFLRTAPVQLQICQDMERLCPDALLLNYTNPMAMLTWLHSEGSSIQNVGLCHSVQHTSEQLARGIGAPYDEVSYLVAGINHQAWFLRFRHNGEDAYPRLREASKQDEEFAEEQVRVELMEQFGYFVTESSKHLSEYLPYFRRTEAMLEEYHLESRAREVPVSMTNNRRRIWQDEIEADDLPDLNRSNEYASAIIESVVTGTPFAFNGNVMNHGLITNLPDGCCVEVPCLVDREGIHPCHVGALPPQCAALNWSNIGVIELAVRAVQNRDREAAFHAVALDPLTASVLPLPEIRKMFDELWAAEGELLDYFNE